MKFVLALFGGIVAVIAVIVLLGSMAFGATWLGIQWDGFFQPMREDVRREVFEQTKSYNEGKTQDLVRYRLQYQRAKDKTERDAIASAARLQFADYDHTQLPPELQTFLKEIDAR